MAFGGGGPLLPPDFDDYARQVRDDARRLAGGRPGSRGRRPRHTGLLVFVVWVLIAVTVIGGGLAWGIAHYEPEGDDSAAVASLR